MPRSWRARRALWDLIVRNQPPAIAHVAFQLSLHRLNARFRHSAVLAPSASPRTLPYRAHVLSVFQPGRRTQASQHCHLLRQYRPLGSPAALRTVTNLNGADYSRSSASSIVHVTTRRKSSRRKMVMHQHDAARLQLTFDEFHNRCVIALLLICRTDVPADDPVAPFIKSCANDIQSRSPNGGRKSPRYPLEGPVRTV